MHFFIIGERLCRLVYEEPILCNMREMGSCLSSQGWILWWYFFSSCRCLFSALGYGLLMNGMWFVVMLLLTLFLSSMSRVHHYFGRRCHFEGLELMVYREQCMTSAPLEPSHTALKHPFIAPHLLISVSICVTLWPIHGYTESGCSRRKLARCKD